MTNEIDINRIGQTKFFKIDKIYVFHVTVWHGQISFILPHFYVITLFTLKRQVCIFSSDLFIVSIVIVTGEPIEIGESS